MIETLAIIFAALPVSGFFATWIPFSTLATLIAGLNEIINKPELFTNFLNGLITDPELQPETLIEGFKETLQHVLEMQ